MLQAGLYLTATQTWIRVCSRRESLLLFWTDGTSMKWFEWFVLRDFTTLLKFSMSSKCPIGNKKKTVCTAQRFQVLHKAISYDGRAQISNHRGISVKTARLD